MFSTCPQLLDVTEAAKRLCLSEKTVRRWARAGKIPCLMLSARCLRFDERLLAEWVQRRAINPASPPPEPEYHRRRRELAAWRRKR